MSQRYNFFWLFCSPQANFFDYFARLSRFFWLFCSQLAIFCWLFCLPEAIFWLLCSLHANFVDYFARRRRFFFIILLAAGDFLTHPARPILKFNLVRQSRTSDFLTILLAAGDFLTILLAAGDFFWLFCSPQAIFLTILPATNLCFHVFLDKFEFSCFFMVFMVHYECWCSFIQLCSLKSN